MPSLTTKQLRHGASADTLPFEVTRKYGESVRYAKPSDVRAALLRDTEKLRELTARIGSLNDRAAVSLLENDITAIGDDLADHCPLLFARVVDEYTGVLYQATVIDRRVT